MDTEPGGEICKGLGAGWGGVPEGPWRDSRKELSGWERLELKRWGCGIEKKGARAAGSRKSRRADLQTGLARVILRLAGPGGGQSSEDLGPRTVVWEAWRPGALSRLAD